MILAGGSTIGDARPVPRSRVLAEHPHLPRRLIAYHEAAHAVVARKLGCTVGHVDITAATARGGECVHVTPDTYRVPGSRPVRGTPLRQETTRRERVAMALRQRDASTATAALAGVALEDIARAAPALDLLPAIETLTGTGLEGLRLRSRSDVRTAAEAARRQHRTDAGRDQFFTARPCAGCQDPARELAGADGRGRRTLGARHARRSGGRSPDAGSDASTEQPSRLTSRRVLVSHHRAARTTGSPRGRHQRPARRVV